MAHVGRHYTGVPQRSHTSRTDAGYIRYTSRLPEIAAEVAKQSSLANKELAEEIMRGAKERVPVRTGALKDAIHIEFKGGGHLGQDLAAVGDWAVVAGDRDRFYGHMVEFGTARAPAHPFLIPALEAMVPHIPGRYRRRFQGLSTRSAMR